MDDAREVVIKFRYETDGQSAKQVSAEADAQFRALKSQAQAAQEAFKKAEASYNALRAAMEDRPESVTQDDIDELKRLSAAMRDAKEESQKWSKELKAAEAEQAKAAKAAEKATQDAVKAQDDAIRAEAQKYNDMREKAEKVGFLGNLMAGGGAAITGPLVLAAQAYTQQAGMAEKTSRKWAYAMQDIGNSTYKIGRTVADQLLPYLERAANLSDKVATWVEKNPGAVKASLTLGGALLVGGTGLKMMQMAMGVVASLGSLGILGKLGMGGAAAATTTLGPMGAAMGGAAAGAGASAAATGGILATIGGILAKIAPVLAPLAGIGIGNKIYDMAKSPGAQSSGEIWGKTLSSAAYSATALFTGGDMEKAKKNFLWVAEKFGLVAQAADDAAKAMDPKNNTQFETGRKMYEGWQQQNADAEAAYNEQRAALVEQGGEQRRAIEENYEQQRTNLVESFAKQQAKAVRDFERQMAQMAQDLAKTMRQMEADFNSSQAEAASAFAEGEAEAEANYYAQRSELAQQYSEETVEAEKAHQKAMKRLREDAQIEIEGAVAARDALALVAAYRNYERNRKRAEEDYRDERKARSAAFAAQIKDLEANFAEERAKRLAAYQEQQAEARADYEQRVAEAKAQYAERRAEAEAQFAEMQAEQQAAYAEQMAELDRAKAEELNRLETANRQAVAELDRRYAKERQLREQAFTDSIIALDANLLNERETRSQYYEQMTADYTAWLQNMAAQMASQAESDSSGGESGSRQTGGYVYGGLWRLHQGEFVMNPDITRAAESIAGGPLSNENMMSMLMRSAKNTLTYNDHRRVAGQVSAQDRAMLRRDTIKTVREMMEYAAA